MRPAKKLFRHLEVEVEGSCSRSMSCTGNPFSAVNDTFTGADGDAPNLTKWSYTVNAGTYPDYGIWIKSNRLRADVQHGVSGPTYGVKSNWSLGAGDFDIQTEFQRASTNTEVGTLQVNFSGSWVYAISVTTTFIDGYQYLADTPGRVTGTDGTYPAPAVGVTGKLRLQLVGSTLTAWIDSAGWKSIKVWSGAPTTETAEVRLSVYHAAQNTVVDFDNFQVNSGSIVWP